MGTPKPPTTWEARNNPCQCYDMHTRLGIQRIYILRNILRSLHAPPQARPPSKHATRAQHGRLRLHAFLACGKHVQPLRPDSPIQTLPGRQGCARDRKTGVGGGDRREKKKNANNTVYDARLAARTGNAVLFVAPTNLVAKRLRIACLSK